MSSAERGYGVGRARRESIRSTVAPAATSDIADAHHATARATTTDLTALSSRALFVAGDSARSLSALDASGAAMRLGDGLAALSRDIDAPLHLHRAERRHVM